MQSRETGRMTKTKSSSNPIAPSEPQQWGSFRFRNTAFSTNRNARACREPFPTDVTGNRLTAPAHTETRPAPPLERHGSLQPQASLVCFNDVHSGGCSPRAVPWSARGCPLQPQISRRQPWERWAPTAAAGQRERKRAFDALPTMQLRPQLRNNQPFTKAK